MKTPWTEWEENKLKELFAAGKSDEEISGEVSHSIVSVKLKRHDFGLKRSAGPRANAWSQEEITIVQEGLEKNLSYPEIKQFLPKRNIQQVREFAINRLNAKVRTVRRWTTEEDEILSVKFLAYTPREEIADLLKRTVAVLNQRILHLGLKRERRRSRLARKFPSAATDPRPIREIVAEIYKQEHAAKEARSAEQAAKVEAALQVMKYALDIGASRRPAFQQAMLEGATLQEVGDVCGITRERVRQIVHGVTHADSIGTLVQRLVKLNDRDYALVLERAAAERGQRS